MVLFETRAVDNGDSIKDLLHHIDDPMVRPSSTFLVPLHLVAFELLVDATRELRPLDKLTPTVSPASSGDILVSFAHHSTAPSPIRSACCKRLQCHHEDRGAVPPPRSRLHVTDGPCEWPRSEMMYIFTVAERPASMVYHVQADRKVGQCNLPCD